MNKRPPVGPWIPTLIAQLPRNRRLLEAVQRSCAAYPSPDGLAPGSTVAGAPASLS